MLAKNTSAMFLLRQFMTARAQAGKIGAIQAVKLAIELWRITL